MKRTTFGSLLSAFQSQTRLSLEVAKNNLKKRNPEIRNYKFRESKIITSRGETIHSIELWQKIDEEHIKFSPSVKAETIEITEARDLQQKEKAKP